MSEQEVAIRRALEISIRGAAPNLASAILSNLLLDGWIVTKTAHPVDDEALVEMAARSGTDTLLLNWDALEPEAQENCRKAMRAALSVYRAHDPLLRKAREALKNLDYLLEAESTPTKRRLADARRDVRAVLHEMEGKV